MKKLFYLALILLIGTAHHLIGFPTIHVFGDSHSYFCFSNNGQRDYIFSYNSLEIPFAVHWLGPKTMYSIGKNGLDLRAYGLQDGDVVVFTFGEIDARCHVIKQRDEKGRAIDEILDSLVANYFDVINQNRKVLDVTFVVMEVMPPTNQSFNPEVPIYGSIQDRVAVTCELNRRLKIACVENEVKFLEIYNICARQDGTLNPKMSDGFVHIHMNYNFHVKQKLMSLLLRRKLMKLLVG